MPEYLSPGVYIKEIGGGAAPIKGVSTSTAAFLGETERGPIRPRPVSSVGDFHRLFGGVFDPNKFLPYAVKGFFENGGQRCHIARVTGAGAKPSEADFGMLKVRANGPGSWGNRIFVKITHSTTNKENGDPVGFRMRVAYWQTLPAGQDPFDAFNDADHPLRPTETEDFDDLVVDDKASPDYFEKRVGSFEMRGAGESAFVTLDQGTIGAEITQPPEGASALSNGDDGAAITAADYEGHHADANKRHGLQALLDGDGSDVSIICAPGQGLNDIGQKVINHCQGQGCCFAVIDCDPDIASVDDLEPRNISDSRNAAFYYPWIEISDPQTGERKKVPPSGHVAGVYARTDIERGVFKSPANETVLGAIGLEYEVNDDAQAILKPRGVNVIRHFPGRGIIVWGARTLASEKVWRYVPVRRLCMFLEESIYNGTQWAVFEPNDEPLWLKLRQSIEPFLLTQWRAGALCGARPEEAFFVKVDSTTMTQDDIANGRLFIIVGVAPVRPAEFVILRIAHSVIPS